MICDHNIRGCGCNADLIVDGTSVDKIMLGLCESVTDILELVLMGFEDDF